MPGLDDRLSDIPASRPRRTLGSRDGARVPADSHNCLSNELSDCPPRVGALPPPPPLNYPPFVRRSWTLIELHRLWLEGISFPIEIRLYQREDDCYYASASHAIHTPLQEEPYEDNRGWSEANGVIKLALGEIITRLEQAVGAGHALSENWFVELPLEA